MGSRALPGAWALPWGQVLVAAGGRWWLLVVLPVPGSLGWQGFLRVPFSWCPVPAAAGEVAQGGGSPSENA